MSEGTTEYSKKLKAVKEIATPELKSFEISSKSRDDYAKLIINYLFILNTGSIASIPVIMNYIKENKFQFIDPYLSFIYFSFGTIFVFACAFFAWVNFFCISSIDEYNYSNAVNKALLEEFKHSNDITFNKKCQENITNANLSIEKHQYWINKTLIVSIVFGISSLCCLLYGWVNVLGRLKL